MGLLSKKNKEILVGPLNVNNPVIIQMLGICSQRDHFIAA